MFQASMLTLPQLLLIICVCLVLLPNLRQSSGTLLIFRFHIYLLLYLQLNVLPHYGTVHHCQSRQLLKAHEKKESRFWIHYDRYISRCLYYSYFRLLEYLSLLSLAARRSLCDFVFSYKPITSTVNHCTLMPTVCFWCTPVPVGNLYFFFTHLPVMPLFLYAICKCHIIVCSILNSIFLLTSNDLSLFASLS